MTRAEMLAELRELIDDTVTPYAWSDVRLLAYLAEGQDKFCEDTGYFRDISSFTITTLSGVAAYAIPDRVIQILDIWNGSSKLGKFEERDRTDARSQWFPSGSSPATGAATSWQTDRETGIITVYPVPDDATAGATLVIHAWRYSAEALNDTDAEPEIPSRFHRACIEWAAFKALSHHDKEKQDPVKAAAHAAAYADYKIEGRAALRRYQNQETRVGSAPAYRT